VTPALVQSIETSDLFRGAYLLCRGGRVGATRLERGQVIFAIEGEGLLEEDLRYRTGSALVNPLQLREVLNLLRDLVFERLKTETDDERSSHGPHPRRRDRLAQAPD
jgi:hypothetical protein